MAAAYSYAAVLLAAVANLRLLYRLLVIPGHSGHVSAGDLPGQGVLPLGAFRSGWGLGLILFGLHLVLLGWLMARSSYLPRWLGWLLFVDGWSWVIDYLGVYVFPNASLSFLNIFFRCGSGVYGLATSVGMEDPGPCDETVTAICLADCNNRRLPLKALRPPLRTLTSSVLVTLVEGNFPWFLVVHSIVLRATLTHRATYEQPTLAPEGIDCMLVIGQVADQGKYTGAKLGRVSYGPGGQPQSTGRCFRTYAARFWS